MNAKYFTELANFNSWADGIVMSWLNQIDDAQWKQMVSSSFNSIEKTAIHIASAEKIWIDFWTNAAEPVYLSASFNGTKNELISIWQNASIGLKTFIAHYPEEQLRQQVIFVYPRGGNGQMEYWQSFAHIVNHSTYHRGQLVTLLRQVGFTGFSSIDLATYYMKGYRD